MKTRLITAGLIFLVNPEIYMVDILPDAIGYFLIFLGMGRLSLIDSDMAAAKKDALYLTMLSVLKIAASFISVTSQFYSDKLTIRFVFAAVEGILGYLMAQNFFRGADMMASRPFGDALIKDLDSLKVFSLVFFPARLLILSAPEFVVLFYPEIDDHTGASGVIDFKAMVDSFTFIRNAVIVISGVLIIALGVYYIRFAENYRRNCAKNKEFCAALAEFYRERVTDNENFAVCMNSERFFDSLFFGTLFFFTFYLENVNIIPRFFAFLFFFRAARSADKLIGKSRLSRVVPLFCAVSFLTYVLRLVRDISGAGSAFGVLVTVLGAADEALSALSLIWLVLRAVKIAKKYTFAEIIPRCVFAAVFAAAGCAASFCNHELKNAPLFIAAAGFAAVAAALYLERRIKDQTMREVSKKYGNS